MKKVLVAIICLCFAFSLVACDSFEDFYNPQISMDPEAVIPGPGEGENGVSHKHLERFGKDGAWLPIDNSEKVFENDVAWEPGYVQMHLLRVVRKVDDNIKYKVDLVVDGKVSELAEYIDVLVLPGLEQLPTNPEALNSWVLIGPLDIMLSHDSTVAQGQIFIDDTPEYVSFGIALRVKEDADAGLELGADIDLNITVEYEKSDAGDEIGCEHEGSENRTEENNPAYTVPNIHDSVVEGKPSHDNEYTKETSGASPSVPDNGDNAGQDPAEKEPVDSNIDLNGDGVIDGKDWGVEGNEGGKKDPSQFLPDGSKEYMADPVIPPEAIDSSVYNG
jgi:hypothetical protein